MQNVNEYLDIEEHSIKKEIETVLRKMCAGNDYREWNDEMKEKIYEQIRCILEDDLYGQHDQDENVSRLVVTEEMVVTAILMYMVNENS